MSDATPAANTETPLPARRSNRPVTAGAVVEYGLARLLLACCRLMGVERASAASGGFMRLVGPLIRPVSRRGEANLRLIFPNWDKARVRRTIAAVWENLGRTVAEYAHLDKFDPSDPAGRIDIVGVERVSELVLSKRSAIFVSGHFANWEIMPIVLRHVGVDFGIVYRAANNPLIDELIINLRAEALSRLQMPKGVLTGRALMEAMSKGRSLALLVDQKLNEGVTAPFLGQPAKTATAAARLAIRYSVPVVPASIMRLNGARFRIFVHEPICFQATADYAGDVVKLTTLINDSIGQAILDRPEQWLWFHRRWAKPGAKR
ncbi:MAG: hypothetical protein WD076_12280 [Parvularculaceae bacterium]